MWKRVAIASMKKTISSNMCSTNW